MGAHIPKGWGPNTTSMKAILKELLRYIFSETYVALFQITFNDTKSTRKSIMATFLFYRCRDYTGSIKKYNSTAVPKNNYRPSDRPCLLRLLY